MDVKGKVAVVTGASRGMGKQMALRLARHGANLVLAARTVETGQSEFPGSLQQTEQEIRALGVECTPVKCDLTVRKDVENLCSVALASTDGSISWSTTRATSAPDITIHSWKLDVDTWEKMSIPT